MPAIEERLQSEDLRCSDLLGGVNKIQKYGEHCDAIKQELEHEFSEKRADDLRLYAREIEQEADAEAFIRAARLAQAS